MNRRVLLFFLYCLELALFYGLALAVSFLIDPNKATFQAGLALFFIAFACVIGRPELPHQFGKLVLRPAVLLMSIVVIGFGVFGRSEPDITVLIPAIGLCCIGAALAERVEQSRQRHRKAK